MCWTRRQFPPQRQIGRQNDRHVRRGRSQKNLRIARRFQPVEVQGATGVAQCVGRDGSSRRNVRSDVKTTDTSVAAEVKKIFGSRVGSSRLKSKGQQESLNVLDETEVPAETSDRTSKRPTRPSRPKSKKSSDRASVPAG